jgi:2',3'-cyclic-nucleotide 2'-phosphodiesterase (5'-nucleotidase family)
VSANVREPDNPDKVFAFDQGARPWIIKDLGGVQVGITGLLGPRFSPDYPPVLPPNVRGQVRVLDSVEAMRTSVPAMRAAGAQIVVLLSHMIHEDTLQVVRAVNGIDVALGTHLGPPVDAQRVNGTIVAVAGPDEMQALGQLDLVIRRGRIADFVWRRHIPSPSDPVERKIQAVVAKYLKRG